MRLDDSRDRQPKMIGHNMKYILTITAATLIGSMAVSAQDKPRGMFDQLDQDKNGIVSHAELMNEVRKNFAEFDRNGNGVIVLDELPEQMPLRGRGQHTLEKMKERFEKHAEKRGDKRGPRVSPEEIEDRMRQSRIQFMAHLDRDENEQLDMTEFAAPMIKRFKRADINGDGSITADEFESAQKRMHKKRGGKRMKRQNR